MINGDINPLKKGIIGYNIEEGMKKTAGGIILHDDTTKEIGIRPRWMRVYKVGKDIKDLKPGQYILVDHGRWTRGFEIMIDGNKETARWVQYSFVMAVQDEKPSQLD